MLFSTNNRVKSLLTSQLLPKIIFGANCLLFMIYSYILLATLKYRTNILEFHICLNIYCQTLTEIKSHNW